MDTITFQCSNCQKVMRIGADKAGRKAKCSRCGHGLVIPSQSQPLDGAAPNPGQAAKSALFGDEDEGEAVYRLKDEEPEFERTSGNKQVDIKDLYKVEDEDDDEDDDEDEKKEAEEREQRRLLAERRKTALARLRKAPIDFSQWDRLRLGILLVLVGVFFWLGAVILQKLVFLFGIGYSSEYAFAASNELINPGEPPEPGKVQTLYRARFIVALVGGVELVNVNMWLYLVSYLFTLIQLVCTGTGYVFCMAAPTRFGARGLAIALIPVVVISFILTLTLKLLPMAGAYQYTMIPLIAPEVGILRSNIEREVPIHLFWSVAPFLECLLSMILHLTTFGELVLFCVFLQALARNMKDERLQPPANALIRLGLSIGFTLTGYLLLINTGTTEVLINVLWIVYLFCIGLYLWFLIWYLIVLFFARERIAKYIRIFGGDEDGAGEGFGGDEDFDEDDDYDDDDDEDDY